MGDVEVALSIATDSRKAGQGGVFAAIKGRARGRSPTLSRGYLQAGRVRVCSPKRHCRMTRAGELDIIVDVYGAGARVRLPEVLPAAACRSRWWGSRAASGKTSTKEMVASVLSQKYRHVKDGRAISTTSWDLPLTVFRLTG